LILFMPEEKNFVVKFSQHFYLLNIDQNVQVSDTTGDAICTNACNKNVL